MLHSPDSRLPLRLQRIVKRDGRVVPFEVRKIEAAIQAAMDAVSDHDATFAREVASVVELTLRERAPSGRVDGARVDGELRGDASEGQEIEDIQDLVERALMELGRPAVAKAYILYREKRARVRAAVRVHRGDVRGLPRVGEADTVSPWSKGRIVGALMEEAELGREASEEIASAVEARVFASGLGHVSTALVRELVAGELAERGLERALRRLGGVGLSRQDLRRTLQGRGAEPWEALLDAGRASAPSVGSSDAGRRVEREVLSRFAVDEVLSPGAAELFRAGDLHVHDLGRPHRPLAIGIPAGLLAEPGDAFRLLAELAPLARVASEVLVIEDLAEIVAPFVRQTRAKSIGGLSGFLSGLRAVARAAGIRIDLASPGARHPAFLARLVLQLASEPEDPLDPYPLRLFIEGHELEDLLGAEPETTDAVDRLLQRGRLQATWGEDDGYCVGPGLHRRRGERGVLACGGAVALNLPRLARRAGPFREDVLLQGAADLVRAAADVARALGEFQARYATEQGLELRPRRTVALVPVGVREALRILGDGELDPELAGRLFGLLDDAAQRFSEGGPALLGPCAFFGERAAARFAWLDARAAREGGHQTWLFRDADDTPAPRAYGAGFDFTSRGGADSGRLAAECLRTVRAGALGFRHDQTGGFERGYERESRPGLEAWRRFEVLRRAQTGELSLELFAVPRPTTEAATTLRPLR